MKNLFKNFNAIGFAALLLIGGSFALKAESSRAPRYYFYDNDGAGANVPAWHSVPPSEESGLVCDPEDQTKICSAEFATAPTTTNNSVASNPTSTFRTLGNIQ